MAALFARMCSCLRAAPGSPTSGRACVFTVSAWTLLAAAFSFYLRSFATYASYYAGLAGIIAALYFMYLAALVLIFGGELNRAIRIRRLARALSHKDGKDPRPAHPPQPDG